MNHRTCLSLLFLLPLAACSSSGEHAPKPASAASEQDRRMAWWREARFGMFIHWGLYSIPAGEWKGETGHAEWIRETAHIPLEEYEQLQPQFHPVKFDAEAWARMAADAGMKYLVITSKHHDGFDLYDSKVSDWDLGGTPEKRDLLGDLAAACARHGLRFSTYHSIMDWHHPDYLPRRGWERRPAAGADFERFERYLHAQVSEIVQRYHPGVLWFDGEWESTWNHERGKRLFELCRKLDPAMIVNNRVDVHRAGMGGFSDSSEALGDFATPEQEIPATGMPGVDWETCMTMNDHWGYNSHDTNWKTTRDLLQKLCEIASKGGNFLLNVGPRADGSFPPEAVKRLAEIGAWMRTNGEAIHGTSASPFESLAFGRCTQKRVGADTLLYLLVTDWPADGRLVVPGLGNEVRSCALLVRPDKQLPVERRGADLVVSVPTARPDADVGVVALRVAGAPIVYREPRISAPAAIFLRSLEVELASGSEALEVRYTLDGSEPGLNSAISPGRITIQESCTLSARSFHRGKPVSPLARAEFKQVAPEPARAARGSMQGLECSIFPGDFDALPDFSREIAATRLVVPDAALPAGYAKEHEARRYRGFVDVPETEVWTFELASDDGSALLVDGRRIVDNDGLHGSTAKRGVCALAAGPHALELCWFNKTGSAELALRWARPGGKPEPIPAAAFSH